MELRGAVGRRTRYAKMVAGVLVMMAGAAVTVHAQGAGQPLAGFQIGDRIAFTVERPVAVQDTLRVQQGLIVHMPSTLGMSDISLQGVRRADIQQYLTEQVGKVLKNPVVRATAFVNIGVSGSVTRPGYYPVPSDAILSDMFMQAGGPTSTADVNKTVVKRDGKVLLDEKQTGEALYRRETLEELGLVSGDQVVIGEQSHHDVQTFVQIGGILLGAAGLIITLAHH